MPRFVLVRNMPMECLLAEDHRPTPHQPRYDVEEHDQAGIPVFCHGAGLHAPEAKQLVEQLEAIAAWER